MSGNLGGGECCGQSSVGNGRRTLWTGSGETPQGLMLDFIVRALTVSGSR